MNKKTQKRRPVARGHQQKRAHVVHLPHPEQREKSKAARRLQLEREAG